MDLQGMQSMALTLRNGQIWLGAPPVALQFILYSSTLWSCKCLLAKSIRSHSDIGKMTGCFWRYYWNRLPYVCWLEPPYELA